MMMIHCLPLSNTFTSLHRDACHRGHVHADTEDSRIGRFIVEEKPHSVVVETALNPSHGSETGNSVNLESCCVEHLAYVAALCTDANLVYGDRPKLTTYQRMLMCPTLADLDTAFGIQCASNYHDLVPMLLLKRT
eukprot:jgi/Picre1/31325/NNA_006678.t1